MNTTWQQMILNLKLKTTAFFIFRRHDSTKTGFWFLDLDHPVFILQSVPVATVEIQKQHSAITSFSNLVHVLSWGMDYVVIMSWLTIFATVLYNFI